MPRPKLSPSPSADSATAAALDVAQNFFGMEAVNRQLALMMAGPIAFTLAKTIDKQLANAVSANGCNGDSSSHRNISPRLLAIEKSRSAKCCGSRFRPVSGERAGQLQSVHQQGGRLASASVEPGIPEGELTLELVVGLLDGTVFDPAVRSALVINRTIPFASRQ
jgi:hypothetical protein